MDSITTFNIISLAAMLLVGTVFSIWYARHEHIEVR